MRPIAVLFGFCLFAARLPAQDFTAIDRAMENSIQALDGGAALLLIQDGKTVYRKGFGTVAVDTPVPLASSTKWLTAAVIMTLVDERKLALDDPIVRYFPALRGPVRRITIRQLLSHTSGVQGFSPCLADRKMTLSRCAQEVLRLRLLYPPGTAFHYGSMGMQLAGRIAEIVSGRDWGTLFQQKLALPLGMIHTAYEDGNPRLAAGAVSTLDDYALFLQMLLDDGMCKERRILSSASVREMRRDQSRGVRLAYTPYEEFRPVNPELPAMHYGLGAWLEATSPLEISSQGQYGFSPWLDVNRHLAGVFSANSSFSKAVPFYFALKKTIREVLASPVN